MHPPKFFNPQDLLQYAHQRLFEKSVFDLVHQTFPKKDLMQWETWQKNKGIVGQSIDSCLGVCSKSIGADFPEIGVEVKTLPLTKNHLPVESTFIAMASLRCSKNLCWENSLVKRKIQHVLWIPLLKPNKENFRQTIFLRPFLWQPLPCDLKIIQRDWEELQYAIFSGNIMKINASFGQYLQLRPKAKNNRVQSLGYDPLGQIKKVFPKAYYLRRESSAYLLAKPLSLM